LGSSASSGASFHSSSDEPDGEEGEEEEEEEDEDEDEDEDEEEDEEEEDDEEEDEEDEEEDDEEEEDDGGSGGCQNDEETQSKTPPCAVWSPALYLDGVPHGVLPEGSAQGVVDELRSRRGRSLPSHISIYHTREGEVRVDGCAGRLMRPILAAKPPAWAATPSDVTGSVRWVCPREQSDMQICEAGGDFPCEIDPSVILSHAAACALPFGAHNPGPRSLFQSNMSRQAVQAPAMRTDASMASCYELEATQSPLCATEASRSLGVDQYGIESVVAILCKGLYRVRVRVRVRVARAPLLTLLP